MNERKNRSQRVPGGKVLKEGHTRHPRSFRPSSDRKRTDSTNMPRFSSTSRKQTSADSPGGVKMSSYQKAKLQYDRIVQQKADRRKEQERRNQEREAALKKYHLKKRKNMKTFSKKTRNGQPLMKERIELLLEKIQHSSSP